MDPCIKVENLNVIYFLGRSNEVQALKDISLEIFPGESELLAAKACSTS